MNYEDKSPEMVTAIPQGHFELLVQVQRVLVLDLSSSSLTWFVKIPTITKKYKLPSPRFIFPCVSYLWRNPRKSHNFSIIFQSIIWVWAMFKTLCHSKGRRRQRTRDLLILLRQGGSAKHHHLAEPPFCFAFLSGGAGAIYDFLRDVQWI